MQANALEFPNAGHDTLVRYSAITKRNKETNGWKTARRKHGIAGLLAVSSTNVAPNLK